MTYDRSRVDADGWTSVDRSPSRRPREVPSAAGERRRRGSENTSNSGLFGSRSSDPRVRIAGFVLAAAGVLMIVCSFFTWASAEDDDLSVAVTGMGTVTFEASEARAQTLGGSEQVAAELDERSKSPGIFTALVGALLLASAVLMMIDRHPGLGAAIGAVLALIAVFLSLEYLFAPGEAVLDGTGGTGLRFAALGLWLVTLGAFVALAASTFATYASVRGGRRSVAPPTPKPSHRQPGVPARPRPSEPQRNRPAMSEPRYRDQPVPQPVRRPNPGARPDPGYRARSGAQSGHLDRRPQPPGHRPPPNTNRVPNPRRPVNQPPSHDGRTVPTQRRRPEPQPGPERGLPPLRRSGPPPPAPPPPPARPRYRSPAAPDDGPPDRR